MKTLVLMNPRARRAQRELLSLKAAIADAPALSRPDIVLTGSPTEASRRAGSAVADGTELVVAAGGDGTVHAVVNGLMEASASSSDERPESTGDGTDPAASRPVLGVVPLGTGNDLMRSLGLPAEPREALRRLGSARRATMDLIRVRQDDGASFYCANVAGGGFGGRVEEAMTDEHKESLGPLAYLQAAFRMVVDPPIYRRTRVRADGERETRLAAYSVVVCNGRFVAGGIPVAPSARMDDGKMDLLVIPAAQLADAGLLAAQLAAGVHLKESARIRFVRARTVRISSEPGMPYSVDGELTGRSRTTRLQMIPGALRVLAGDGRKGAL